MKNLIREDVITMPEHDAWKVVLDKVIEIVEWINEQEINKLNSKEN